MRLLKIIVALLVLGFLGLAGFAYLGDMNAKTDEMRVPVPLDITTGTAEAPAPAPAPAQAAPLPDDAATDAVE